MFQCMDLFHPKYENSQRERYDDGITGTAVVSLLSSVTRPVKETVFITTAMPWCRNGHESENTLLYALKLEQKHKN